tara:strand:- start:33672 stop:34553 length:882 start_codon:yes stop_codon:yes gene_type:complete
MARYLPTLNAVRAFEAAGRHGSFTGAAAELNVSHAAISRHVRGLEKQLSTPLFRIVARGVALTEQGAQFLAEVTPALNQISSAADALRSARSGSLTITCEPTFATKWLIARLGTFEDAHPEIDVSLDSSADLSDIRNGAFDVGIRFCTRAYDGLLADPVSMSHVYPYATPDFPTINSPLELLNHRLLHEDDGELWHRWFDYVGHPDPAFPVTPRRLNSVLAIEGALAGQGIVLASEELVSHDVAHGRLKRLCELGMDFGGYYLMSSQESARRRPVRLFREWMARETSNFRKSC